MIDISLIPISEVVGVLTFKFDHCDIIFGKDAVRYVRGIIKSISDIYLSTTINYA